MRPNYCPNCGNQLKGKNSAVECVGPDGSEVWDCYCSNCGWSGDISPDKPIDSKGHKCSNCESCRCKT